uniref:Uncharacterized protein n=1 Tax=Romanomermis culicivorax TaxID=13658 RepID=A0A915HKD3_ROMCU
MLGTLLMASHIGKSPCKSNKWMQIEQMDDQGRRHLHRNGVPQKDQKMAILSIDEGGGPKAQAPACSQQALGKPTRGSIQVRENGLLHNLRGLAKELALTVTPTNVVTQMIRYCQKKCGFRNRHPSSV